MSSSVDFGTLAVGVLLGSMAHKSIKKLTNTGLVLSAGLLGSAATAAAANVDPKVAKEAANAAAAAANAVNGQNG